VLELAVHLVAEEHQTMGTRKLGHLLECCAVHQRPLAVRRSVSVS
jgi:hypothetical protein